MDSTSERGSRPSHTVSTVDPQEFRAAWLAVVKAQRSTPTPLQTPIVDQVVKLKDGTKHGIWDSSFLKVVGIVLLETKGGKEKAQAITLRMLGLMLLVQIKALEPHTYRENGQTMVPEYLLDIAAILPVSASGFDKQTFLDAVQEYQRKLKENSK